ncbi:FliM/FliN family flagellar motor C-terminal domain-containing protein [Xanthomonas hydrangeae]|uniref:FliM/FliN family flagellar motor C-terminal domain-containing protein n=1 Tax=Xanthomonas hydrangeae TaxID=2775159 RepID=A0AAU0BGS4_9XANT|nr:FliM/FliN family flagellar motor C-terminal domain-containing protein [Xanthomonas hydrangeae]WOB51107.1 FliM/FliN family flagellar motor C-terminal domain-containing protein [Xanthomonas hydrangeae]
MKRLGWIRPASAQALCDLLQVRFGEWLTEWSVAHGQVDEGVRVTVTAAAEDVADVLQWQIVTTSIGGLFGMRLRKGTPSTLGAMLMDLSGAADGQLCGNVGEQALQALAGTLAGMPLLKTPSRTHPVDPLRFSLRHGALHATARWDEFEVELIADSVWCAAEDDSVVPAELPVLTARSGALRSQSVALHAQLILGEVELGEVSTLRVGEVLVVDSDAAAPLQLMNGTHVLAAARLVVAGGQRALELH